MKCMDCGRGVGNWPAWLTNTSIEVRCARCAGSGANVINGPKASATRVMAEENRRKDEVLEPA